MKKSTGTKSKPKFAKKRANAKNPTTKSDSKTMPKAQANPSPKPPPQPDVVEQVSEPAPQPASCSPAVTQAGHHEVVQS